MINIIPKSLKFFLVEIILSGIKPYTFAMFKNNPEEFIVKAIRLINEQKAAI